MTGEAAPVMDFSNFELMPGGRPVNVLDLAPNEEGKGVLREMGEVWDIPFEDVPTLATIQQLFNEVGAKPHLRDNLPSVRRKLGTDETGLEIAARWVKQSKIQERLFRSMHGPTPKPPKSPTSVLQTGNVPNWMDRAAEEEMLAIAEGRVAPRTPLWLVGAATPMTRATEVANSNHKAWTKAHGRSPSQDQYLADVIAPHVGVAYDTHVAAFPHMSGDDLAKKFIAQRSDLFLPDPETGEVPTIIFSRNANGGLPIIGQFRRMAREVFKGAQIDTDPNNPQFYAMTDAYSVATTPEQARDAGNFQNPQTALRQIASAGKEVHAAGHPTEPWV